MLAVGPGAERRSTQYSAWCETCAIGSPRFDRDVAEGLVALHLIDPELTPVRGDLDAEAIRARADAELGSPFPWL